LLNNYLMKTPNRIYYLNIIAFHYLLCSLLIFLPSILYSQNRNSTWCFGDSAGIDFSGANPSPIISGINSRGGVVSISDTSGSLMFYAGGTPDAGTIIRGAKAFNKLNNIMLNGDSIIGRAWYREHVITPMPDSDSLYYLFSAGVTSEYGFFIPLLI